MVSISTLSNGFTVLIDEMPSVHSTSYCMMLPGGLAYDSASTIGASLVHADMLSKGAGSLDARALSSKFEHSGILHSEGASKTSFVLQGSCVDEMLPEALSLVSKMVTEPTLPEDHIASVGSILEQDILSLMDSPSRRAVIELQKRYLPDPFNRPSVGTSEGISAVTQNILIDAHQRFFVPQGAVLSLAGNVQQDVILPQLEALYSSWAGEAVERVRFGTLPAFVTDHISADSAQTQIACGFPGPQFGDKFYYTARIVQQILSGGMFGRLFVEVREKKGLCYSVNARHISTRDYGMFLLYAGTTPERADETMSTMIEVIASLSDGVSDDELARAKANLKASVVLGDDSSYSRASFNAGDWWNTGEVRTTEEILQCVDGVSSDDIASFFSVYPAVPCSSLVIGKSPLSVEF